MLKTARLYTVDSIASGIDGRGHVRYASLGGVLKTSLPEAPFLVANDYIGSRLALILGLPVPPGDLAQTPHGLAYVSLRFDTRGGNPPPAILAHLVADLPRIAAGIVVADWLTFNDDRYDEQIAYVRHQDPVAFDWDNSLFGPDELPRDFSAIVDAPLTRGALESLLENGDDLAYWCDRVSRQLVPDVINTVCRRARHAGAVDATQASAAADFLKARASRISGIFRAAKTSFPKVNSWPLF